MWTTVSNRKIQVALGLAATAAILVACSEDAGPASPSNTTPTFTITAAGVSPKQVRINVGDRVRFTNDDSVNRQINSNPFLEHDDCPPINAVDLLTPGQSKETDVMSLAGTCGFHEHLTEGDAAFLGEILVGSAAAPGAEPPAY